MSLRTAALVLIATTTFGFRPLLAQAPRIAPRASVVFAAASAPADEAVLSGGILGDGSKDYRYTGFWVGTGTGLFLSYMSYEFCQDSDSGCTANAGQLLLGTLMITATTSLFGALVGAQFNK